MSFFVLNTEGRRPEMSIDLFPRKFRKVDQTFHRIHNLEKYNTLEKLIDEHDRSHFLVFVDTNQMADFVAFNLTEKLGNPTPCVHEGRSRRVRKLARERFRIGCHDVLVATSAAVCGPDIKDVDVVVNYDLPASLEEYIRRLEKLEKLRRVGRRGTVVSFCDINVAQDTDFLAAAGIITPHVLHHPSLYYVPQLGGLL